MASSNEQTITYPTFDVGPGITTTFDISKIYIIARFQDTSKCMLATILSSTPTPFPSILTFLEENFNPGSSAKDKENAVDIFLLMSGPLKNEENKIVARAFLGMLDEVIVFKVGERAILDGEYFGFKNGEEMSVNVMERSPLRIGRKGHILKTGGQGKKAPGNEES